ncbi:MAG: PF20097 family protein [Oscillospiraceae bacterium]
MTIGDKCPYCGRELLSGYLQSARQIIWSQEEKSISFRADEDGDLVVSHGIWEGALPTAGTVQTAASSCWSAPRSRRNSASACAENSAACAAATQRNKERPHAAFCRVRFVVFQKDQTLKRKSVTSPSCMT